VHATQFAAVAYFIL